MIDKAVFAAEMTLLRDRFGRRDMTPETIARYHDYLAPRLDTTQFRSAAREIFNRDTFWPAPARFLEVLQGGSARELAEGMWSEMMRLAARGKHPARDTLDAPTRAALQAVGGHREIQFCESDAKLARLKREFTTAYERAATEGPAPRPLPELPADVG